MTATSEIGRSAEILIGDRPIAAVGIGVQGRELGVGGFSTSPWSDHQPINFGLDSRSSEWFIAAGRTECGIRVERRSRASKAFIQNRIDLGADGVSDHCPCCLAPDRVPSIVLSHASTSSTGARDRLKRERATI